MAYRRPKPKTLSMFSLEYYKKNKGDTATIFLLIITAGCVNRITSLISNKFVFMQHEFEYENNVYPNSVWERKLSFGVYDFLTIIYYAVVCFIIDDIIRESICEKLIKPMRPSKTTNTKLIETSRVLFSNIISVAMGIFILYNDKSFIVSTHDLIDIERNSDYISYFVKFWFVLQVGNWIQSFVNIYFTKVNSTDLSNRWIYYSYHLILPVSFIYFKLYRFGFVVMMINYSVEFLMNLTTCILHMSEYYNLYINKTVIFFYNLMTLIARILLIYMHLFIMTQIKSSLYNLISNNVAFVIFSAIMIIHQVWLLAYLFISNRKALKIVNALKSANFICKLIHDLEKKVQHVLRAILLLIFLIFTDYSVQKERYVWLNLLRKYWMSVPVDDLNMLIRDPQGINDHLQDQGSLSIKLNLLNNLIMYKSPPLLIFKGRMAYVRFEDVIAEPDGTNSPEWSWRAGYWCFHGGKNFCYKNEQCSFSYNSYKYITSLAFC
ncbi:Translocating chain-associated membrane protein 1-like 1 [Intoshia linei]|uniref:Translocating chain-associated membrane protein 1-like 1 n=1 Tax=Intoshia linei TaxID=1819745 RepID=A0A177AUB5_9BILA|nr:Translocating chain-associated membrane protein 1-like 1 [Intoshia linei]